MGNYIVTGTCLPRMSELSWFVYITSHMKLHVKFDAEKAKRSELLSCDAGFDLFCEIKVGEECLCMSPALEEKENPTCLVRSTCHMSCILIT